MRMARQEGRGSIESVGYVETGHRPWSSWYNDLVDEI